MKNFQVMFASAVLLLVSLSTATDAITIKLSALRPDLEYLRGTWLQNPDNSDLQGRLIISNRSELVVVFERSANSNGGVGLCPSDANVEAWTQDSLHLENLNAAVEALFYKHGTFYIRRYRCDFPEVLDKDSWVEMLAVKPENDLMESVEIRYVTLKTLGKEIEQEVSRIDSELTGMEGLILKSTKSSVVTVHLEENEFSFEYQKGHRFVDVRNVRTMQFPRKDREDFDEEVLLYKGAQHFVDFAVTRDYPFVRYDRRLKSFFTPANEELDSRWVVRSNVGNYVLRVGSDSTFKTVCVPPHLCSSKSSDTE